MSEFTNGIEADFWDVDPDVERLSSESLAEAAANYVEGWRSKEPLSAVIAELAPFTFYAWKRQTVSQETIRGIAISLGEHVIEGLEEYVDPDGDNDSDEALESRLQEAFAEILKRELTAGEWQSWGCEKIGKVELNAAQIEELLRGLHPHWFAESA